MQAIIDACHGGQIDAEVSLVISNVADAGGLHKAASAGIQTCVIRHSEYDSREAFDQALIDAIDPQRPTLVVLAGFMRILSSGFIKRYQDRLINIHPSLLPRYKGLDTHQRALDNADTEHGASVHYVCDELDSGAVVLQASVPVKKGDNARSLAARVLEKEHIIYPLAIQLHVSGQICSRDNRVLYKGRPLASPLSLEELLSEQDSETA